MQDPETGETLPRHALELRQKHARQMARLKLREEKAEWQKQRAKERAKEQQLRKEQREITFTRQVNARAQREVARRAKEAAANTPAAMQAQINRELRDAKRANARATPKAQGTKAQENAAKRAYDEAVAAGKFDGQLPTATIKEPTAEEREAAKGERAPGRREGGPHPPRAGAGGGSQERPPGRLAQEHGVDPEHLKAAAEEIAARKFSPEDQDYNEGIDAAAARSGLTPARIGAMEDADQDYGDVPGFDEVVDEMASDYPILGMGGKAGESGQGDPEQLWQLLKAGRRPQPQWYDCLDEAADLAKEGQAEYREPGADEDQGDLVAPAWATRAACPGKISPGGG